MSLPRIPETSGEGTPHPLSTALTGQMEIWRIRTSEGELEVIARCSKAAQGQVWLVEEMTDLLPPAERKSVAYDRDQILQRTRIQQAHQPQTDSPAARRPDDGHELMTAIRDLLEVQKASIERDAQNKESSIAATERSAEFQAKALELKQQEIALSLRFKEEERQRALNQKLFNLMAKHEERAKMVEQRNASDRGEVTKFYSERFVTYAREGTQAKKDYVKSQANMIMPILGALGHLETMAGRQNDDPSKIVELRKAEFALTELLNDLIMSDSTKELSERRAASALATYGQTERRETFEKVDIAAPGTVVPTANFVSLF